VPSAERIVAATARLDPESRALVELTWRRRMGAGDIAAVLGVDAAEVRQRQDAALGKLAAELGEPHTRRDMLRDHLARIDEAEWRGEAPRRRVVEPVERPAEPAAPRRRRLVLAALALLVVAAVVAVVIASGSSDEKSKPAGSTSASGRTVSTTQTAPSGTTPTETTTTPSPGASSGALTMERLNGTYGHGTAQLAGDRLQIRATGFLKPVGGGYAVWLVNSSSDARRLYSTAGTSIERDFTLPSDWKRYRYVEVARAIPDLTSDYSGLALLRVSTSDLAGA
jgi:hypothetical protein